MSENAFACGCPREVLWLLDSLSWVGSAVYLDLAVLSLFGCSFPGSLFYPEEVQFLHWSLSCFSQICKSFFVFCFIAAMALVSLGYLLLLINIFKFIFLSSIWFSAFSLSLWCVAFSIFFCKFYGFLVIAQLCLWVMFPRTFLRLYAYCKFPADVGNDAHFIRVYVC